MHLPITSEAGSASSSIHLQTLRPEPPKLDSGLDGYNTTMQTCQMMQVPHPIACQQRQLASTNDDHRIMSNSRSGEGLSQIHVVGTNHKQISAILRNVLHTTNIVTNQTPPKPKASYLLRSAQHKDQNVGPSLDRFVCSLIVIRPPLCLNLRRDVKNVHSIHSSPPQQRGTLQEGGQWSVPKYTSLEVHVQYDYRMPEKVRSTRTKCITFEIQSRGKDLLTHLT